MLLTLHASIQELVLQCLDTRSIADWASTCRDARAMVQAGRTNFQLCNSSLTGGYAGSWLWSVISRERRSACEAAVTGMHWADWPSELVSVKHFQRIPQGKKGYLVEVDVACNTRIDCCLREVAGQRPEYVMVACDEKYNYTLCDYHLEHLSHVPFVAIPGNKGITDSGLAFLSHARVIWLGGCSGIQGDNLPSLVYSGGPFNLLSIKYVGGWGTDRPFNDGATRWLHKQEALGLIVDTW